MIFFVNSYKRISFSCNWKMSPSAKCQSQAYTCHWSTNRDIPDNSGCQESFKSMDLMADGCMADFNVKSYDNIGLFLHKTRNFSSRVKIKKDIKCTVNLPWFYFVEENESWKTRQSPGTQNQYNFTSSKFSIERAFWDTNKCIRIDPYCQEE